MTYYPTLAEDLQRAKEILEKGKPEYHRTHGYGCPHDGDPLIQPTPTDCPCDEHGDVPSIGNISMQRGGTIYGADTYAAYKLLESFVTAIERLQIDLQKCGELGAEELTKRHDAEVQVEDLRKWKEAIIDATVTDWIFTKEHETNPRKAVNDLLCWQQKIALDPAISQEAAALHEEIACQKARVEEFQRQVLDQQRRAETAEMALKEFRRG